MRNHWMRLMVATAGLAAAAMTLPATPSFAAGYGAAGCGLGSMVFGTKNGFVQVFAATTNGTSGNQTFGITSGTSNCGIGSGKSPRIDAELRIKDFITANLATLKVESARGNGESIAALASLYGCDGSATTVRTFGALTQQEHGRIFAKSDPQAVNAALSSTLHADSQLSQSCAYAT